MITLSHEWSQTEQNIEIIVQLPVGTNSQKCEIKIGIEMVSISAPGNYILRLWVIGFELYIGDGIRCSGFFEDISFSIMNFSGTYGYKK